MLTSEVIRRFRVRIPGGFITTCWPNGKASDYGALLLADSSSFVYMIGGVGFSLFSTMLPKGRADINFLFKMNRRRSTSFWILHTTVVQIKDSENTTRTVLL